MESTDWYRLGDGYLGIRSEHTGFRTRFADLFAGCMEVPPPGTSAPLVTCEVTTPASGGVSLIRFDDPQPLDVVDFAVRLFADRGCRESSTGSPRGRAFGFTSTGSEMVIAGPDGSLIADNSQPWEWLIGNIAVHRLLRLQSRVAALHAGSIAIGKRGVLLVGPKGSGKTTLSMTLAARGCGFLGDEMAALRLDSFELIPVRRSVSVRPGPRSPRVDAALQAAMLAPEPFPDGAVRLRAKIDELFPENVAAPVRLASIVFLRGVCRRPLLERVTVAREHLGLLTPLPSTLWNMPRAERAIRLLGILPKARCFWLDAGEPEETADRVEEAMRGSWD
jgi:hypothetical protein